MKNVWPSALHILCQWHTLNAVWRFCNNGNNGIMKPVLDPNIVTIVQKDGLCWDQRKIWGVLPRPSLRRHCKNIRNLFVIWSGNVLQDQKSSQSISEWKIICPYILHGVNTSNITEASFRVFRDVTLNRTKCFNACELQLEMLKDDASYYRDKL